MNDRIPLPNGESVLKAPSWRSGRYRLTLGVADLKRSETFYSGILGFWPLKRTATIVHLAQDNLELVLESDKMPLPRKLPSGFRFGFWVGTQREVGLWGSFLESRGVRIKEAAHRNDSGISLVFLDPDDYPIEVYWDSE